MNIDDIQKLLKIGNSTKKKDKLKENNKKLRKCVFNTQIADINSLFCGFCTMEIQFFDFLI